MEKPSLPKGTRDFGPSAMAKRQFIFDTIRNVFQKFGFLPLETPAMENLSVLEGKYGDEANKLLYKIRSNKSLRAKLAPDKIRILDLVYSYWLPQKSSIGLRYDLTVPFARYVVMNRHEITLPFKRFQMQPVWRADNPQKGRYREFYQCDADVVGTYSLICEAEIILMIREVFGKLGINDFTIKINHRNILEGVATLIGAKGKEMELYTAIDKLDKIGEKGVRDELETKGFDEQAQDTLFNLLNTKGSNKEKLDFLASVLPETGQKGLNDLNEIFSLLSGYGTNDDNVEVDISLARGLSYYTGTIFEVKINNVTIGSVSGGGRYDNLTQAFGSKEPLPGIGISFGVDRIYDAMEELNLFPKDALLSSTVLVCHFNKETIQFGLAVLARLREKNIAGEIYPDQAKLKKQLDYANKKMIPFAVVIGSDEMKSGQLTFKDMASGEQVSLTVDQIIQRLAAS